MIGTPWETFTGADDFQYRISTITQAFVNGANHWVGYHKRELMASGYRKRAVVLFDMCDEELRVMKLPHHLTGLGFGDDVVLGVSGGLLSLMEYI